MTDTCKERIEEHWESRKEDFSDLFLLSNIFDSDEFENKDVVEASDRQDIPVLNSDVDTVRESALNRIWEYSLAIDEWKTYQILLSTGGSQDALIVSVDSDHIIRKIEYEFSDWFDTATIQLVGEDFKKAKSFISVLMPY